MSDCVAMNLNYFYCDFCRSKINIAPFGDKIKVYWGVGGCGQFVECKCPVCGIKEKREVYVDHLCKTDKAKW